MALIMRVSGLLLRLIFSVSAALGSMSLAIGNECQFSQPPVILFEQAHELHQVWTLDDLPIYASQTLTDDPSLSNYRSEIKKRVPDLNQISILQREYQDFIKSGNPNYLAEAGPTKLVYSKQAGTIRSINCLESLLLTVQLKRQLMIEHPSEFSAFILKNTDPAQPKLKIYYSTFDRPGGKINPRVTALVEADLAQGWVLWRHLHNHNFFFSNSVSVMGGTCPSRPDLQLYLDLVHNEGLQTAAVTNGFDTLEMSGADFINLNSP